MGQQMVDGDLLNALPVGPPAVFRTQDAVFSKESVFASEATAFEQAKNCGRGDGLGHTRYTKETGVVSRSRES